jgi:flagella basal body P-ring formation protein FlgA
MLLALQSSAALAAPSASQQINQVVASHFQIELNKEAARQGWRGMRFSHDTSLPSRIARLPPCPTQVRLHASSGPDSILDRQRFEISCPGQTGWPVSIVSQANVFLPTAHAQRLIERGQTIDADDIKLEPLNIGKARQGFFNQPKDVIGMTAKRRIRINQTLTPALVSPPLAVRRGQTVKIIAQHQDIEATTTGEALDDGQTGAIIRVKNLGSEKIIDAKVIEAGVVSSTY